MSSSKRQIALWRGRLSLFEEELYTYNRTNGLQHNPALRTCVHPSVWSTISEQLLHHTEKSNIGEPPRHEAVERYLRGMGIYQTTHGTPGQVYCSDPLAVYKSLGWPDVATLSYVTAFDIYMSRWRDFTQTLQQVDRLDDDELAPIMTAAIKPKWLQDTIVNKIATGKGPRLIGETTRWRKLAKENLTTLIAVIRENAEMAEMLRGTDELSRWILPARNTNTTQTVAPAVATQGM